MSCTRCLHCKVKKDTFEYVVYCKVGRWGVAKMKFDHLPSIEELEKRRGVHTFYQKCYQFEEV